MVFQFKNRLVIPSSEFKRMLTSYQLRSITVRQTYWNGINLGSALYGPPVNASCPIGSFNEDYGYVAGLGDLDMCNGRWTKTPDYPNSTQVYFSTTNSSGYPTYLYLVGPTFYGNEPTSMAEQTRYTYYQYVNSTSSERLNEMKFEIFASVLVVFFEELSLNIFDSRPEKLRCLFVIALKPQGLFA